MAVHAPVSQGKLSSSLLPAKHLKHSLKALATLSFSCLWQMPWKHFDFTYYTFVDLLNVSVKELKRKRRDMAHVHKALIFDINNWSESVARRCAHMSSLRSHFRRTLSHPAKKKKKKPTNTHQHLAFVFSGKRYNQYSLPAPTTLQWSWISIRSSSDRRWWKHDTRGCLRRRCINSFPHSSVWTSVQPVSSETDVNSDRRSIVTALHAAFCC